MPAITTRGAASAKGFGFTNGGVPVTYIEDVFSIYLYTGTGATQTITNGINLSTKGGMIWFKSRTSAQAHGIVNTLTGVNTDQNSNSTGAAQNITGDFSSFNSTGFTLLAPTMTSNFNGSPENYTSWTFREQSKFFDVVTYTGTGSNTTIAHTLGSVPGCIIVKRTDTTADWAVYHRSLANTQYLALNTTAAATTGATWWNSTTPTSSVFSVGTDASVNASGGTYVAYLFAHDAGGFGLAGTDNVISCGSYTGNGSATGPVVTLGYEPQWLLIRKSSDTGNWQIMDNMRGLPVGSADATLQANLTTIETSVEYVSPTATGFQITSTDTEVNTNAATYIYIAIRRGPMRVPTVGTSVFAPFSSSGATGTRLTTNFPVDSGWFDYSGGDTNNASVLDRLRGVPGTSTDTATNRFLRTSALAAEATTAVSGYEWWNTGIRIGPYYATYSTAYWLFGRAPGFFDEVCYTGTGVARTVTHNLTVAPELVIIKNRGAAAGWSVGGNVLTTPTSNYLVLQSTAAMGSVANLWQTFGATTFGMGSGNPSDSSFNANTNTYVAYLFATCAGVSKVGSYTGNGSSQTIACGFAAGSRFVMIKRTDSAGDWYVWDSARGIVAGNDPHLSVNTTVAEVTTDDSVDTDNSGFIVNQLAATNINVTSATYIFLAIA